MAPSPRVLFLDFTYFIADLCDVSPHHHLGGGAVDYLE